MYELSVIIITKNESSNIRDCLNSLVGVANEVIVLDSGSIDDTCKIASECGAKVVRRDDWRGFGAQKNRALELVEKDWVLSIDADERLSPELNSEIKDVLSNPLVDCYLIPRKSWYCGRFIKHSGWRPDYVARLFKKGAASFSTNLVHEKLEYSGPTKKLNSNLIHYSFVDFSQVLAKMDAYSTHSAQQMYQAGRRAGILSAIGHGLWSFFRTYFLKLGFLDGAQGFMLAVSNAQGSYYRYVKLWLLENEIKKNAD